MHIHTHEIMNDSTQAQSLAKVFNSPKIKHLNKVLTWSTKSEVLHGGRPSGSASVRSPCGESLSSAFVERAKGQALGPPGLEH
jgi:hypothetical protein